MTVTTTPNPTAEAVIAQALANLDARQIEMEDHREDARTIAHDLRAHGLLSEGAPSEERRGINLMRDLGFDESDPEVVKARADAAFEEQIERAARAYDPEAWAARDKYAADGTGTQVELDLMVEYSIGKARAALTAAGVAAHGPCPQPCEHLSAEDAREGRDCREHPCTCPTAPSSDREKLIAEATEFIDSWDRLGSWTPDSPIGMVMRLRNALAASLDPVKVAEVERAAAARALEEAADRIKAGAGRQTKHTIALTLRARAAEIREGES